MKEKKRWKGIVALVLCMGLLPGCGKTEPVEDTEEEYVVELYEEPGTESLAVNEPETEAQSLQAEPPTEEIVSDMLGSFLNWSALCSQSMSNVLGEARDLDGLTPKYMVAMAAHAASVNDVRVTTDDSLGCYVVTEDVLKEYEENLFGQTCDASEYTLDETDEAYVDDRGVNLRDGMGVQSDGSVCVVMGDWGTAGPWFQVQEIGRIDDTNRFLVKVDYLRYFVDQETGDVSYEKAMKAEYTLEPSADSSYGYVITDMKYMESESVSSE